MERFPFTGRVMGFAILPHKTFGILTGLLIHFNVQRLTGGIARLRLYTLCALCALCGG